MVDGKFPQEVWPHEWIKQIRSRPARHGSSKRMRQVDLAGRAGVDPRTVQQWENGDRLPSAGSLKRMIQAFFEDGLFLENDPRTEAEGLWSAVKRFSEARSATSRDFPAFDATWFETLALPDGRPAGPVKPVQPVSIPGASKLPRLASHFIGRTGAQSELEDRLGQYRLVSVVGPGGIGKTSFAVHAAAALSQQFPQGIWLFEFATIKDSPGLSQLLMSTLGLQGQPHRTDLDLVLEALSGQKVLFIFDNCEHVIDACAAVAESLLAGSEGLCILATSREPLNIGGESVFRIPPLSFPADELALQDLPAEEITAFEAVQLFVERARHSAPHFQPTIRNLRLVGAICKRLEGIPLAIELAVSRLNMLTLEQMEERLANVLTLLTSGKRTAAPRQQTLRSAIDWSYDLLTGREQLLLRRLSVFSGGFSLEAAEYICSCEPGLARREDPVIAEDMLDLLSGLVNKSLISIEISGDDRSIRYVMLEAIKEYTDGKLGEESDGYKRHLLSERHVHYYSQYLVRAEPKFRTREREACIGEVRQEYANLRTALEWSYSNPQARSSGLHMVSNLYWFWLHEGRLKEGILWLDRFLDSKGDNEPPGADYIKAMHGKGVITFIQGKLESAQTAAKRSVELARGLGESALLAASLRLLTFIHIRQKRFEEAEATVQQSVDLSRSAEDLWNLASSLHAYGKLRLEQKDYHEASLLLNESVRIFESIQDQWEISGPYESLGYSALKLGNLQSSMESFKKCIAASQIYQGAWVLSRGIEGLALALFSKKDYTEAAILLGAAEKGRQRSGAEAKPNFPLEHEEAFLALQHVFTEPKLGELWSKGREMSRFQALAYSLEV
ncbi:tetratricopeptide repeat protein [Paenibacillus typhae]|uniref:tetratricopeptide repeat protein n=1 Tax=Paenibacillus typhae TaxID=1174501 RepID=UPI001C8D38D9|nr:tetratricopeptide repeat protein [Paenibacillus typhae]MBY0013410.1 tetratricopeptide repeat protein [Paenibacillus typhae]